MKLELVGASLTFIAVVAEKDGELFEVYRDGASSLPKSGSQSRSGDGSNSD